MATPRRIWPRRSGAWGVRLPEPLRDLYRLIGRRPDLVRAQDRLLAPNLLSVDTSGQALEFRVENQAAAWWGIPLAAVREPDPPVLFRLESARDEERAWQPYLGRLSLAIVEMLLSKWLIAGNDVEFKDSRELDDESVRTLETTFDRLLLPDYPLWAAPQGKPVRWLTSPGTVMRTDADTWLWVCANSEDALDSVRNTLPGDWLGPA